MMADFPVIESILSPQVLAKDVLPEFGVGPAAKANFYTNGFNHTYQFKMEDGRVYYLRVYRIGWRNLDDIQYELGVLEHLKGKEFPAVRPVPYKDGRLFCAVDSPEGKRYLALFEEAPGPEISYEVEPGEIAKMYGRAVAEMHNALDDFGTTHKRFHLDLDHFIERSLRYAEPFLVERPEDGAFLKQFGEKLRKRIESLPETALERGVCHGDLQGYHAKIAPDGMLTFYDFDCGGYGYRAYDLAVFLWCCRLEEAVNTRWEPFINSYGNHRVISELDVTAVPLFVCARYLWHVGVHTQNSQEWGIGFLNDKYFDTHLKRLKQAEADYLLS